MNEAIEQIAYADRIVLNKTDLVSAADLARVESKVRHINRMARIARSQRAQVDLDYVLGVGGFDLERVEQEVNPELLANKKKEHHHHHHHHEDGHECGPDCSHDHDHDHDHEHEHKEGEACGVCGHHHAEGEEHHHDHDHGAFP